MRVGNDNGNFQGGPGACSPRKILENLDYLGLHFGCYHGGQTEKWNIVVKRGSKSPPLDLLKIQRRAQNNGSLVTCQMAGRIKFSPDIPRFCRLNIYLTFKYSKAVNYMYISELVKTVNHI